MKRCFAMLVCALSISLAGCATHSGSEAKAGRRAEAAAARQAAEKWLKLLDDGDYEEAFEWEARDFRLSRTQAQFVRSMQAHRAPFGHFISRGVIGAASLHKLVGMPDGSYASIVFKTVFEHKPATAERVILAKQSVGWRVIDYRIY